AFRRHHHLLLEVTGGNAGHNPGNAAHLIGEVVGHDVHAVGQILPDSGYAGHLCLAAQLTFGAHLAGDPRHLAGEAVELVHHGVDGVLELENLAAHIHRNLAGEVAVGHRRGDRRDVTHLAGQVTGHQVHAVSEVL